MKTYINVIDKTQSIFIFVGNGHEIKNEIIRAQHAFEIFTNNIFWTDRNYALVIDVDNRTGFVASEKLFNEWIVNGMIKVME